MRTIDRASAFKRDYKREAKGQHRATLDNDLKPVLMAMASGAPLDSVKSGSFQALSDALGSTS